MGTYALIPAAKNTGRPSPNREANPTAALLAATGPKIGISAKEFRLFASGCIPLVLTGGRKTNDNNLLPIPHGSNIDVWIFP